jgi:RNA polymerase sigma-70 factor (ECF subfamily)
LKTRTATTHAPPPKAGAPIGGRRRRTPAPAAAPVPVAAAVAAPAAGAAREERRLIEGCRRGDFECFERLVGRYEKKVYNLALRMLRDPDDAREVLQETFLKVYDNLEKFRGDAQLSTWIYRIAMNEALMRIRKDKHRPRSLEVVDEEGERREIDVEDWSPRPVERLLTKELGGELDRAIARLPEDYRGAFLLRDVEGLSNEQIAKAMKLSVPAVKSRIHRARVFLRNELSPYLIKQSRGD